MTHSPSPTSYALVVVVVKSSLFSPYLPPPDGWWGSRSMAGSRNSSLRWCWCIHPLPSCCNNIFYLSEKFFTAAQANPWVPRSMSKITWRSYTMLPRLRLKLTLAAVTFLFIFHADCNRHKGFINKNSFAKRRQAVNLRWNKGGERNQPGYSILWAPREMACIGEKKIKGNKEPARNPELEKKGILFLWVSRKISVWILSASIFGALRDRSMNPRDHPSVKKLR